MKYKNEIQIKKAMGIESWRNLSRDKVIRFAAMMPDMDKENKKFYENLNSKYVKATVAALLSALVFIGGKVALDQFLGLPLEDKEDEDK